MKHALQAKDYTPTLEEVMGDDITTFPPDPKDLDLAKAIRPGLRPSPEDGDNIFTDGEVTYYCIEVEREIRRTLASSRFVTSRVWCRTTWNYVSGVSGVYWEPPELEEQPLDEESGCWLSLSDAARATAHDALDREIDALDNTCYECFGCGKESPLDESGGDCKTCNGEGYIPASKI